MSMLGNRLVMLVLVLVLTSCGAPTPLVDGPPDGAPNGEDDGNGDGNGEITVLPPSAPTLSLTPTAIKTFGFAWDPIDGVDGYRLLEDPTGTSSLEPIAAIASGEVTYDHEVFLPTRVNARYQVQACNAGGCAESNVVTVAGPLVEAIGYVKASNTGAEDRFGSSVALSGDGTTLAVGAYLEASDATGVGGDQSNDASNQAGALYVFVRSGMGSWVQQAYVKASNTGVSRSFGWSVALSGDGSTLAVGAPLESSSATGVNGNQSNTGATASGAVYVFTRDHDAWTQQAYVKASNTRPLHRFGHSVTLSGDGGTLAVGAPREDSSAEGVDGDQASTGATNAGAAYLFVRSGSVWSQQAYVKASNTAASAEFGSSLALSGDGHTLAVGAPREASDARGVGGDERNEDASDAGAVYVFTRHRGTWTQQAYVKASNTDSFQRFGTSVALSGNGAVLAVGSPGERSRAAGIEGDQGDTSGTNVGAVYVFIRGVAGGWKQQAYVKASEPASSDRFGTIVALSLDGLTLAVAAPGDTTGGRGIYDERPGFSIEGTGGAAYVLTAAGSGWGQEAYVKASNNRVVFTEFGDTFGFEFGSSAALSGDGSTLAVGATWESSGATGVGGDQYDESAFVSGAVYLY